MSNVSANVAVVKRMALGPDAGDGADAHVTTDGITIEEQATGDPADALAENLRATVHEDAVFHVPPSMPYGGDHVGHDAFRRMGAAMLATWEIVDNLNMKFVDAGEDTVICFVSFDGKSKHTDRPISMRMVEVYTLDDGKIREASLFYWDTAEVVAVTGGAKTLQPA